MPVLSDDVVVGIHFPSESSSGRFHLPTQSRQQHAPAARPADCGDARPISQWSR